MITNEMLNAYDTAILNHSPLADRTCGCGQKFKNPGEWHDHKIKKALEAVEALIRKQAETSAIARVRELHKPVQAYRTIFHCSNKDEDHCDNYHVAASDSDSVVCIDLPTDPCCEHCITLEHERLEYPCPTIRTLKGDAQ